MNSLLDLNNTQARAFLLKSESYTNVDFPNYLEFGLILKKVDNALNGKPLKSLSNMARDYEGVNHSMLSNKDGRYAWRPFQLIHPALYVSLVSQITEQQNWKTICGRFKLFSEIEHFECLSLPAQSSSKKRSDKASQILQWWNGIEQASISMALDYNHIFQADISDCYSSIYTHSIAWALHGREIAKTNKNSDGLIGNIIDKHIQDMRHGQTNGIPQGSVLMDFIAEMVLGYADLLLSEKLTNENDYKILRYRDDYRIFVNSPSAGEKILKCLTEVLIELGMKLNTSKTTGGQSVVSHSVKADKKTFLRSRQSTRDLRKTLLLLHIHGTEYPNAGSLTTALSKFHKRLLRHKKINNPIPLISISVDIAYNSPRTFPFCAAIVSKLLLSVPKKERAAILEKIHKKLTQLPNVGHMEVWLQRVGYQYSSDIDFKEPICKLVSGVKINIWNNDWITAKVLKQSLKSEAIVNKKKLNAMKAIVQSREIDLFHYGYEG